MGNKFGYQRGGPGEPDAGGSHTHDHDGQQQCGATAVVVANMTNDQPSQPTGNTSHRKSGERTQRGRGLPAGAEQRCDQGLVGASRQALTTLFKHGRHLSMLNVSPQKTACL
ncbi:hypothetical protein DCC25_08935 [Auritidibacter sp. NML120636]|nr:hypothetical protein DCC25_08935 [Auritidibacter sp. NML120636]